MKIVISEVYDGVQVVVEDGGFIHLNVHVSSEEIARLLEFLGHTVEIEEDV